MIKNILILGGTGTIGQYLIDLYRKAPNVYVVVTTRRQIPSANNIQFIRGNAHNETFLKSILSSKDWTAIVDLMSYKTDEFSNRVDLLLASTKHYIYISSSRVYADNGTEPIKEDSPRLLDVCKDKNYLKTDEYALTKARQENILHAQSQKNWSIVRPYITFGPDRLQLGIYEKELWLYRALKGKPIVFPKELLDKYTTLTPNKDVSSFIYHLIKLDDAKGECYHVTGEYCVKWKDIINLYATALSQNKGIKVKVCYTDQAIVQPGSYYQYKYDRCYNRVFDNQKANNIYKIDRNHSEQYLKMCIGGGFCQNQFKSISWRIEAVMDRRSKYFHNIFEIPTIKNKILYLVYRILPLNL